MNYHVLIVDDEVTLLKALKESFSSEGYHVLTASTPEEAIERVQWETIDVVISDLKMPGMDGLEFLKVVKSFNERIEVILYTAFGSLETAVEALRLKAFDYITKPFQVDDMKKILREALEHKTKGSQVPPDSGAGVSFGIEEEIVTWNAKQIKALGKNEPARTGLSGCARIFEPRKSSAVFFDLIRVAEHMTLIVAGKIRGPHSESGLFMPLVRNLVRAEAGHEESPGALLSRINTVLTNDDLFDCPVSLFLGAFNLKNMRLTYANGGHDAPLLVRKKKMSAEFLMSTGLAAGVSENMEYHEKSIKIDAGDSLVLYSDELLFFQDEGEGMGAERFRDFFLSEVLHEKGEPLVVRLIDKIEKQRKNSGNTSSAGFFLVDVYGKAPRRMKHKIWIPAQEQSLAKVTSLTTEIVKKIEHAPDKQHAVVASVNEIVANSIEHAYRKKQDEGIEIIYKLEKGELLVDIADSGDGFAMERYHVPDTNDYDRLLEARGRGLFLAERLMGSLTVDSREGQGTRVILKKKMTAESGSR